MPPKGLAFHWVPVCSAVLKAPGTGQGPALLKTGPQVGVGLDYRSDLVCSSLCFKS